MKIRLAIVAVLAVCLSMTAASAAFALSGTGNGNATAAQYQVQPGPNGGQNLPTIAPAPGAGTRTVVLQGRVAQQVAQERGGSLAFTGFPVIALLLVGSGLLVAGIVTRRRISGSTAH